MKRLFGLVVMLLLVGSLFSAPKTAYLVFYPYENTREELLRLESVLEEGMGLEAESYISTEGQYWIRMKLREFDFDDYMQLVAFSQLDEVTMAIMGVESEYIQKDFHYLIYKLKMSAFELSLRFDLANL